MFLKSLVLRGFKSFADKTTLAFEPGVTIVVGPNGSGKSNIVDAISWVLGEQGPRSLRGGKMEDVIFAGSRLRPALGMSEVTLTIDNSAGLLPIEFTEVSIARVLFRSGESEYRLNGAPCRLLDVQEVLSDTGIGRQQHTIIGQGQLDAVLSADPAQMRAFIEEAAGVAKHRRRKDRALRKIAATEQNLTRLSDLLAEIRRQLRPLREQAEAARRHTGVAEELGRVRLVEAARELAMLGDRLGPGEQAGLYGPIRNKEGELTALEGRLTALEHERNESFQRSDAQREAAWSLARAAERLEGLMRLGEERRRSLEAVLQTSTRAAAQAQIDELARQRDEAQRQAGEAAGAEQASEAEAADLRAEAEAFAATVAGAERAVVTLRGEVREAVAGMVGARGEISAVKASLEVAEAERGRMSGRAAQLSEARAAARERLEAARQEASKLEAEEPSIAAEADRLDGQIAAAEADRVQAQKLIYQAERAAARWRAAAGEPVSILISKGNPQEVEGVTSLAEALGAENDVAGLPLDGVFIVDSTAEAVRIAGMDRGGVFVTRDHAVVVGPVVVRTPAEMQARAQDAQSQLAEAEARLAEIEATITTLGAQRHQTEVRLNELDAAISATTDTVSGFDREIHALERELQAVSDAQSESAHATAQLRAKLDALGAGIPEMESKASRAETELQRLTEEHSRLRAEHDAKASAHDEARLRLARAAERRRLLEERLATIIDAFTKAEAAAAGLQGKREAISAAIGRAGEVVSVAGRLREAAQGWAAGADASFRRAREDLEQIENSIESARGERAALASALEDLRARAREEDIGRSEFRIRARILEERIREEWQTDPQEAASKFGHVWEVEDPSKVEDPAEKLALLSDEDLQRRHARLERDLQSMGRVNAYAAQEFESLTGREEFLAGQLADVRASRRDLFKIVATVDEQIRDMFASAYQDVAREYERLFAMLFPGGQGRLRLTDPSTLLETGVEVEARPGGKNLKRLSLLSGGERALSALAVLFAIFRARPSPFYILDEVEAALDDVNLHRFLGLLREFRGTSQLLVVTHQKRTMEAADVLYGVSIRPDGASRVISERLSESSPELEELHGRVPTQRN
jgi:chromosome segregation protein